MKNSDDRQRAYVRKHYEMRKAEGKVKCSFWLDQDAADALAFLVDRTPGMTKGQIINRALRIVEYQALKDEVALQKLLDGTAEFKIP